MLHIGDRNREYLEGKINEFEINGKNKNIIDLYRGINELKESYRPWTDLVKVRKGNLHVDSYIVVNRWKTHFFQLLNVFWVNGISRLKYIELGKLCVEIEVAIEKVRRYKYTGIDQITAEFDSCRRWVNVFWNTYKC